MLDSHQISNGQSSELKHLCIADPSSDPEGKRGMVYTIPPEVIPSLGVISDSTKFYITGARLVQNNALADRIILESVWSVEVLGTTNRHRMQLNLLNVFGTQSVIVAHVSARDSSVTYDANNLQRRYFGTDAASVALQYNQCSVGQYNLVPAADTNGVVELSWDVTSSGVDVKDLAIENSFWAEFKRLFGNPEDYGHVIYCLGGLPSGFNSF